MDKDNEEPTYVCTYKEKIIHNGKLSTKLCWSHSLRHQNSSTSSTLYLSVRYKFVSISFKYLPYIAFWSLVVAETKNSSRYLNKWFKINWPVARHNSQLKLKHTGQSSLSLIIIIIRIFELVSGTGLCRECDSGTHEVQRDGLRSEEAYRGGDTCSVKWIPVPPNDNVLLTSAQTHLDVCMRALISSKLYPAAEPLCSPWIWENNRGTMKSTGRV